MVALDEKRKTALRKCHSDLREGIRVKHILPDLRPHLTHPEYESVDSLKDNCDKVDELVRTLLTKTKGDFDHFCAVLRKHGYGDMANKLKASERGECSYSLSCTPGCVKTFAHYYLCTYPSFIASPTSFATGVKKVLFALPRCVGE